MDGAITQAIVYSEYRVAGLRQLCKPGRKADYRLRRLRLGLHPISATPIRGVARLCTKQRRLRLRIKQPEPVGADASCWCVRCSVEADLQTLWPSLAP